MVLSVLLILLVLANAVTLISCSFAHAHWSGKGAAHVAGALGLVHGLDVVSQLVDSQHGKVVFAVVRSAIAVEAEFPRCREISASSIVSTCILGGLLVGKESISSHSGVRYVNTAGLMGRSLKSLESSFFSSVEASSFSAATRIWISVMRMGAMWLE